MQTRRNTLTPHGASVWFDQGGDIIYRDHFDEIKLRKTGVKSNVFWSFIVSRIAIYFYFLCAFSCKILMLHSVTRAFGDASLVVPDFGIGKCFDQSVAIFSCIL
jgi:hypothetical protein